jgi:multidrug efflux pump subunit AcrA (membrane-fusion protein)
MFELRTRTAGTVVHVEVDEGQMVAEDDEIAVFESDGGRIVVTTEVPGVVRELYIEAGYRVGAGAVIALIDES